MDPVKGFFTKYHAVPGNDAGPVWKDAATDAIEGQLTSMLNACSEPGGQGQLALLGLRTQISGAAKELMGRKDRKISYPDLVGILEICERK